MIRPDTATIERLRGEYDVIPLCKEIYADVVTPITLLRRIAAKSRRFFLLESIEGGERWGRYSFLGLDPLVRITSKGGRVTLERGGEAVPCGAPPLEALRELLAQYRAPRLEELPPFSGGLVGYFAYEMFALAEPGLHLHESEAADYDLMLFHKVIAYDHLTQKIHIVVNMPTGRAGGGSLLDSYGKAVTDIEALQRLILDPLPLPTAHTAAKPQFTCNVTKEDYCAAVEKTKEYIRAGDIFQAVISRRFETPYHDSLLSAYRVLRTTNPSPYMVFFQADEMQIVASSPETLVKLQNGRLSTFPVAGSRPRGATPQEDAALEKELLADEKELAEHNMLVDLARNDIGKIARYGSVEVTQYKLVHRYSKIMHLTSVVEGELRQGLDALDAVAALLPAGTLSGAPKIRAAEIIDEIEDAPRGVYGGAIGYIDLSGNLDVCIAIRMAVAHQGRVCVQAGGGIVADSVPETEYLESENKARAVMEALARASEVDD